MHAGGWPSRRQMGGWREERRLARSRDSVSCLPGREEDRFPGPLPCPVDASSSLLEPPPVSPGPAEERGGARGWGGPGPGRCPHLTWSLITFPEDGSLSPRTWAWGAPPASLSVVVLRGADPVGEGGPGLPGPSRRSLQRPVALHTTSINNQTLSAPCGCPCSYPNRVRRKCSF